MEYNFRDIEKKWREYWIANKVYQVEINEKPNMCWICFLIRRERDCM